MIIESKAGLEDAICAADKELRFLRTIKPWCTFCLHREDTSEGHVCVIHDHQTIPPEFIQVACDSWQHDTDGCPF